MRLVVKKEKNTRFSVHDFQNKVKEVGGGGDRVSEPVRLASPSRTRTRCGVTSCYVVHIHIQWPADPVAGIRVVQWSTSSRPSNAVM